MRNCTKWRNVYLPLLAGAPLLLDCELFMFGGELCQFWPDAALVGGI